MATAIAGGSSDSLRADEFRRAPQQAIGGEPAAASMRPVPRFSGTSVRDPQRAVQSPPTTQNLQWRTSSEVAQAAPPSVSAPVASQPASQHQAAQAQSQNILRQPHAEHHAQRPAAPVVLSAVDPQPVRQVQFDTPQPLQFAQAGQQSPQLPPTIQPGLQVPPGLQPPPPIVDRPLPDFFDDPTPGMPDAPPTQTVPPPLTLPPPQVPQIQGDLRESTQPAQPVPLFPAPEPSPFPGAAQGVEDVVPPREIEDFEMPRRGGRQPAAPVNPREDMTLIRPVAFSCDEFRRSIAEATIQRTSLDISPPFRPDVIELDEFQKLKQRFLERQDIRTWNSVDGRSLGRGRMRDLAYENVIIQTEFGTLEELPVNRLSEADLAYVSSQWGLPQECLIQQPAYVPRTWLASQITWKASNLIHKPLYFEEVNLERYGHTAGPFLQPVVSSAHFFVNVAVLPYKMGVHSPHECQYVLGYYRPGNCAPWIVPPVPLSLRGALFQAGAITGQGLLIP